MRKLSSLGFFALFILVHGCAETGLSQPGKSDAQILQSDMIDLASKRVESFDHQLQFDIEIIKVEGSNPTISMAFKFTNVSDSSLVFKKPRSTGFASLDYSHSAFNDVSILVNDNNGNRIQVNPSSDFRMEPGMFDIHQRYEWHQYSDFVVIESGYSYTYEINDFKPIILGTDGKNYPLSKGKYKLYAGYGNIYIGYQNADPAIGGFDFTYDSSTTIIDLNAWVGTVLSNTVDLEIR